MVGAGDAFRGDRRARAGSSLAAVLAGLALVGVVGAASGRSVWHARAGGPRVSTSVVDGLALVAGIALVVGLLILWVGTPGGVRVRRERRRLSPAELGEIGAGVRTSGKVVLGAIVVVLGLCALAVPFLSTGSTPKRSAPAPRTGHASAGQGRPGVGGTGTSSAVRWFLVAGGATLLALLPVAVAVRRSAGRSRQTAEEIPASVPRAAAISLGRPESERDARSSIVLAYAHMEHDLAGVDVVRSPNETASEFLVRVSRVLRESSPAAAALTERFEAARFSGRELSERDRTSAIESLREIERELGAAQA